MKRKADTDWEDVSTSHGVPKRARQPQELGERQGTEAPAQPSEGAHLLTVI